ncbi:hypothetical protein VTH06DRAFT_5837 [Thermothelomyces fergusii]
MAVEINRRHLVPGRLVNGIDQLASWCENLIHVDEELRTVRFAHQAIQQFIIDLPTEPQFEIFRFDLADADHHAGEMVTADSEHHIAKKPWLKQSRANFSEMLASALQWRHYALARVAEELVEEREIIAAILDLAARGDVEQLKDLFAEGFPRNEIILNSFHQATKYGQDYVVQRLLAAAGRDIINIKSEAHQTLLHVACVCGNIGLAKHLIEAGTDINLKDDDGMTPLLYASTYGNIDLAKHLIEAGADVNITDNDGRTPLSYASGCGNTELAQQLLETGADVNITDNDGWSPLCYASAKGYIEVVRQLLTAEADVNLKDHDGWSSLSYASSNGHIEAVRQLLEAGADVNIKANDGSTPLCNASANGYIEVVKQLLAAGADVNITDNDGRTPLSYASMNGSREIVKQLSKAKASLKI